MRLGGPTNVNLIVDVVETNSSATAGLITVQLRNSGHWSFSSFDDTETLMNGYSLNNVNWGYAGLTGMFYTFTSSVVIPAGDISRFGFSGDWDIGTLQGRGQDTFTVQIVGGSGGEIVVTNNLDAAQMLFSSE